MKEGSSLASVEQGQGGMGMGMCMAWHGMAVHGIGWLFSAGAGLSLCGSFGRNALDR